MFPGLFSELFNVAASRPAQMTTKYLFLVLAPGPVKPTARRKHRPAAAFMAAR